MFSTVSIGVFLALHEQMAKTYFYNGSRCHYISGINYFSKTALIET